MFALAYQIDGVVLKQIKSHLLLVEKYSYQLELMISPRSLSDRKSAQVTRTLLSILTDL